MRGETMWEFNTPNFRVVWSVTPCDDLDLSWDDDGSIREAVQRIKYIGGYNNCEASDYPVSSPRWLTFYGIEEDYSTGAETNWSLHIPEHVTPSSRVRIARLFGCYGVK